MSGLVLGTGGRTKTLVEVYNVETSSTLAVGDLVNFYDDAGTTKVRHADATAGYTAHGFVRDAYAIGETAIVWMEGLISNKSGLTTGAWIYAGDDGQVSESAPIGNVQIVGYAISATTVSFEPMHEWDYTSLVWDSEVFTNSTIDSSVIGGTTPAAGTFTTLASTGATTIGDAAGDTLTVNAAAWTLANATTVTGTWADLGSVTTIDINGGSVDGVTIGAAAAGAGTFTTLVATTSITGTLATASQTAVTGLGTITTGTWEATDVAVLHGGTGASTASDARTNLGLAIGSDVQAFDATLLSLATLGTAADKVAYTTAVDTWAETALTAYGRSLIDDADAATARATLGLVIGTDVQAEDAGLTSIAGLVTAADKMIYTTALDTYAVTPLSAFGRTLVDDADASTARTTLGLVIGTDVQAYNADLAAIAAATWTGATSITTLGTIATGTWQGTAIASAYIGAHTQAASTITAGTFTAGSYSFTGSDFDDLGLVGTVDINGGTLDGSVIGASTPAAAYFTTISALSTTTFNTVAYTWPSALGNVGDRLQLGAGGALTWVATSSEGSGTFTSITITNDVDFTGATVADLGTVTTADIDGGTIDGTVIGASTPAAITGTTGVFTGELLAGGAALLSTANAAEFHRASDAGIGLYRTSTANTSDECFIAYYAKDAGGSTQKVASISSHWVDTAAVDGYSVLRFNSTYQSGGVQTDDLQLRMWGGNGATFFAADDLAASAPGAGILKVNGTLTVTGSIAASSMALTGGATNTTTSAAPYTAYSLRNLSADVAASGRFVWGNDASSAGATATLFSSAHSTYPNYFRIIQEFNAPFILGSNGAETIRMTGTATEFAGTVSAASIQSTPIGSVTPSTGAFTTLGATTSVTVTAAVPYFETVETDASNQTWRVSGSAGSLLITDITGGTSPIIVGATAPNNSLRIDASGNVILGATATSSNAQFYATKTYSGGASNIYHGYFKATQSTAQTGGTTVRALHAEAILSHTTGTQPLAAALRGYVAITGSGGTTTSAAAAKLRVDVSVGATLTEGIGLEIESPTIGGTLTTPYAIKSSWSAPSYLAGSLRIGTTAATSHGGEALLVSKAGSVSPLAVIQASDSNPAYLHFVNSTTGSSAGDGLRIGIDASENAVIGNNEATAVIIKTSDTERLRIDASKPVLYINDSANANMTAGLTINQGAADDEAFALKSSDVAHGYTAVAETDTYLSVAKASATGGGVLMRAVAEDAAVTGVVSIYSYGGTATTAKSTSGTGLVDFYIAEHDGANAIADVAADGNILSVRARVGGSNLTRLLLDEDGDLWLSGGLLTGGATPTFQVTENGNVVIGSAALATTATDGFLCITSMPGAPTGTPTAYAGRPPIVWDSTNDLLKLYDGAWLTIGGPVKRGACYMTTPAATTISVAGTYYKAAGTTTSNNLAGFLSSTSNRLTYNGPGTVHVHVAASASLTSAGTNVVVGLRLAKNGDATTTDAVATTARTKVTTGTDIGDHAVHGDFALSNGDYIELFVTNETDTNTVTVDNLYLFAMAMATS